MSLRFISLSFALWFLASAAFGQAPATGLTVEYVASHSELWPKQVITKGPVQLVVQPNGGVATTLTLPAGQLMKLIAVEGGNVRLDYQGTSVTVPASQTDLLAGAASNQARLTAASRPPAPRLPTPAPGAKPDASAAPPAAGPVQNVVGVFLKDSLLAFRNDSVVPVPNSQVAGKRFIALYFATRSKEACKVFTPKLKQFYSSHRSESSKFEIVFVPTDHSAKETAYHIRETEMPWVAVDFARQEIIGGLRQTFGGSDVPNLVVVDENGRVLVNALDGKPPVGVEKAMADFGQLLDRS